MLLRLSFLPASLSFWFLFFAAEYRVQLMWYASEIASRNDSKCNAGVSSVWLGKAKVIVSSIALSAVMAALVSSNIWGMHPRDAGLVCSRGRVWVNIIYDNKHSVELCGGCEPPVLLERCFAWLPKPWTITVTNHNACMHASVAYCMCAWVHVLVVWCAHACVTASACAFMLSAQRGRNDPLWALCCYFHLGLQRHFQPCLQAQIKESYRAYDFE